MLHLLSVVAFLGLSLSPALPAVRTEQFPSGGRGVHYEVFPSDRAEAPVLILLPGTSGPEAPFYRSQAAFFAGQGYTTLLLHYFDAAGSRTPSDETYRAWSKALEDLVQVAGSSPQFKGRPVFVVGYSLGASVALAAGSENLPVGAIAEWYGSLPDSFFQKLGGGMPPLLILHGARDENIPVINAQQLVRLCGMKHFDCADHIYPDEAHGFSDKALADAERRTLQFFAGHGKPVAESAPAATNP